MATNNNLTDLLQDIADAIREKKGTSDLINPQDFSKEIKSIEGDGGGGTTPSRPTYTGHADVEGLKAIGWDDNDIAYYQANGVNWNEEDDEYHKVSEDNKALYGVLTANNLSSYKERIVYLPKIDTSSWVNMNLMFSGCYSLIAIPQLNTAKVTNMGSMFNNCYSLATIPQLDAAKVTNMSNMFSHCYSLATIPQLNTAKVTNMSNMFNNCYSLATIPQLDAAKVTNMSNMFSNCYSLATIPQLNTSIVTNMSYMFNNCYSLATIPQLDTAKVTNMSNMFSNCYSLATIPQLDTAKVTSMGSMFYGCRSLITANLKNVKLAYQLNNSTLLSKESLLYIINNAVATSAITIKLATYAYDKWANDADVVAALANHTNISLSK